MNKKNYVFKELNKILNDEKELVNGYADVFYALYMEHFNFTYANSEWINKDKIYTDNELLFDSFNKLFKLEDNKFYDLPLPTIIGEILGTKKINGFIYDFNKKTKIMNHYNYLVCDYNKLSSPDYLAGAYYSKNKDINNLVVIAIKSEEDRSTNLINIYEECNYLIIELNKCNYKGISNAIKNGKKSKKPVLIIVNNSKQNNNNKKIEQFDYIEEIKNRTNIIYKKWLLEYDKITNNKEEQVIEIINYLKEPSLGVNLEAIQFNLDASYENTIINSSLKIEQIIKNKSKYFSMVEIKDERVASLVAAGLAKSKLKVNVEITSFKKLSDIVNLCVEFKLPVNFILKNVNQAVYIDNLNVFIPSDMHEVIGSWSAIIKSNKPSVLILSDKETTLIKNTNIKYVKYGAYMIKKEKTDLKAILVASGEEVKLALGVAGLLEKENIYIRVVSMPCANLLAKQVKYAKELLSRKVKVFVLDKTNNVVNYKFVSNIDCLISSDLGLDKVKEKIKDELSI